MGHGVDITQHKNAEAELRTRVRQQAAVAELGQVALAGTELSAIVGKVVSLVAETLDVECCKILELLLDGRTLAVRAEVRRAVGDSHGELVVDETRLPYSLFCDAPMIIDDLRTEKRFGGSSLLAEQGMVSGMLVMIQGRTQPAGILGAFTTQLRLFDKDDLNFLQAIANLLANLMESKKAEAALRAERDYSEAIIEGSPAIICGIDAQGKTTYINPAGERITGYRAEEIVGENWWQLLFPGDGDLQSKLWMEELRKGDVRDHELALKARDGQKRIISWNLICFRNDDGEVIEVIGFGRDITRRKQLEEQLGQSQKMEAVGRLAGGVAHDFNNLLTVISGYSDLILEDLDSDSIIHSDVEEILRASERAASLTRQLLAFSRRQVLKPKLISLSSVVADSEKMLRRLIGEDIDLVILLDSGIGAVRADPGQIEQVILNLAVNARDAMPQGGRITIATRNLDLDEAFVARHPYAQTGPHVLLAFGDTGAGMDDETRSRIFEPFFTTKEPGTGTGLGLSTVYGIVKQSGGVIWVENGSQGGTQFNICLPRVDKPPDEDVVRASAVQQQHRGETILLVEDEPSVRTMVRRILQEEGYHVIEAREGLEAFEIASRAGQSIRLLLTDIVMPHMGGRELAERLVPVHPKMKVVYMTGYTEQAISDAPFLHKPFTSKGLLAKLREVLDTPAPRAQAAASGS
jgi:PAS domain S-box-containing protein